MTEIERNERLAQLRSEEISMEKAYPIIMTSGEKHIVVYIPDFNINTQGEDIPDAIAMARDAIELIGMDMLADGESLPEASTLADVRELAPPGGIVMLVDVT